MSMSPDEYYKAPDESIFDDIKFNAIKIWQTYDDTYGYATEKINRIQKIENLSDNCAYIVAMFDQDNQRTLYWAVKDKTKEWLEKLLDD